MVQEPAQARSLRPVSPARWLVVVILAGVAGALLVELGRTASAIGQGVAEPSREGRGLLVVPGQITRDGYGLYLVDGEKGKMCVYQYQPTNGQLRLLASRNFTYDLSLDEYNTAPPPREIKDLVEQQGRAVAPAALEPTSAPAKE